MAEKTAKAEGKKTKGKEKRESRPSSLSRLARAVKGEKKAEAKKSQQEKALAFSGDPYDVLKFVLMTEKSVRQIELQNKLVFIVDRNSDKSRIKAAAQVAFNSPISEVRTLIDQVGRKKAFIKFAQEGAAGEIAIRLGII
jgi:large subunit ribosomal protein L23